MDYSLTIVNTGYNCYVEVLHRREKYCLLKLQSSEARALIESGVLSSEYCVTGHYSCNKALVWHLLLAAISLIENASRSNARPVKKYIEVAKDLSVPFSQCKIQRKGTVAFSCKLERALDLESHNLAPEQYVIANTLVKNQHTHLTQTDVEVLLLLESLYINSTIVRHTLEKFANNGWIKIIQVTKYIQFYDLNTAPHAHVYCEKTNQLYDAEVDGCVYLHPCQDSVAISGNRIANSSIRVRIKENWGNVTA